MHKGVGRIQEQPDSPFILDTSFIMWPHISKRVESDIRLSILLVIPSLIV